MADSITNAVATEKTCPKCSQMLPASEFWRQATSSDGLQNRCKSCFYRYRREADDRYMATGRHATKQREAHFRRNYGITVAEVDEMARKQKFRCQLCAGRSGKHGLHVDHDHATGRVRGLLCHNCNRAIGYFKDDSDLMLRAALYVMGGESDGR